MIDVTLKLPEAGQMIKKLGLNQRGAVQKAIAQEALMRCEELIPFDTGMLKQSGRVEDNGGIIVWKQPYARYQYYGMLMVDPDSKKAAMFNTDIGFWSKPGVTKELTDKPLEYQGQGQSHWFEKAMQNGGREQLINVCREEVRKRSK
nr:MAG TPA: Minor capsid protein [Caudoviricetes sp.]